MLEELVQGVPLLASEEANFVEGTLLYVAGGLLVLLVLGVAFYGMARPEGFPSGKATKPLLGVAGVLVVLTAWGAVANARFEQSERRAENQEAAAEAEAEEAANEEAEADQGAGEAAEPEEDAEPAPAEGEGGGAGAEGEALFVDTGCGSCHTFAAAGTNAAVGPNLDEVLPGQDLEEIETSIVDPGAKITEGFGDGIMPATYGDQLSEQQVRALAEYLESNAG